MSRKAWRRWRREGRECPRGNELVFTRPTRPTSRQTKKQLTTIRTRRKDQHDHLKCLPTNTTNIKKNLEAARRPNNETLVNANFETADYHPEATYIRYCFSKWRLNCCHIAVSGQRLEDVDSVFWYKRIFLQLCCRPKDSSRRLSGRSLNGSFRNGLKCHSLYKNPI